jgi:hypothetical protein
LLGVGVRARSDGELLLLRLGTRMSRVVGAGFRLSGHRPHRVLLSSTGGAGTLSPDRVVEHPALGFVTHEIGQAHEVTAVAREPWYRRAGRGALAGVAATVAMSAVQFPGASAGGRRPPPVEITRRLHLLAGRRPGRGTLYAEGIALHLGFGAAAGALYALVAPRRLRELSATAYAAMLYGTSYRGYLPALGLHPSGEHDDTTRHAANVAGHVVYALTLAEALRLTEPAHDPDPPSSL